MFDRSAIASVADILVYRAASTPDAVAIKVGATIVTFADLDLSAARAAEALKAAGVRAGDRVAYCGLASETFFETLFGATRLGSVFVPLNWRLSEAELIAIIADAQAGIVFLGEGYETLSEGLRAGCPSLDHIVPVTGYSAWCQDNASNAGNFDAFVHRPDDAVLQIYTSGTTGAPKGVVLTNANYMAVLHQSYAAGWADWTETDRVLVCMPLFHVGGINVGLISLAHGATAVVTPKAELPLILETITRERITIAFLAPTLIATIATSPLLANSDATSVRRIYYGTAPISETVLAAARTVFSAGFVQLYGLTEATGTIAFLSERAHDEGGKRLRACGQANAGVEIRVVAADGKVAATGESGEIIARGACIMKDYWRRPRETAEAVRDGWLHTGDIGYFDEGGYLFIHDRLKDMIVSGGENVYPAEVENVLAMHPSILEAAVIGVPDDKWGEAVKAVVVLRQGHVEDESDVVAFVRSHIAAYKIPRSVEFVSALPRSAVGKVLKRELRATYWASSARSVN